MGKIINRKIRGKKKVYKKNKKTKRKNRRKKYGGSLRRPIQLQDEKLNEYEISITNPELALKHVTKLHFIGQPEFKCNIQNMLPLLKKDPNHFTLEKNGFQLITLEDNDLDLLDEEKNLELLDLCIKSCIKELEKSGGKREWEICVFVNLRSGAFLTRRAAARGRIGFSTKASGRSAANTPIFSSVHSDIGTISGSSVGSAKYLPHYFAAARDYLIDGSGIQETCTFSFDDEDFDLLNIWIATGGDEEYKEVSNTNLAMADISAINLEDNAWRLLSRPRSVGVGVGEKETMEPVLQYKDHIKDVFYSHTPLKVGQGYIFYTNKTPHAAWTNLLAESDHTRNSSEIRIAIRKMRSPEEKQSEIERRMRLIKQKEEEIKFKRLGYSCEVNDEGDKYIIKICILSDVSLGISMKRTGGFIVVTKVEDNSICRDYIGCLSEWPDTHADNLDLGKTREFPQWDYFSQEDKDELILNGYKEEEWPPYNVWEWAKGLNTGDILKNLSDIEYKRCDINDRDSRLSFLKKRPVFMEFERKK